MKLNKRILFRMFKDIAVQRFPLQFPPPVKVPTWAAGALGKSQELTGVGLFKLSAAHRCYPPYDIPQKDTMWFNKAS
jgi:hypothetical protein